MTTVTTGLVEQHIHGAFGVDFNKCSEEELIFVAKKLQEYKYDRRRY